MEMLAPRRARISLGISFSTIRDDFRKFLAPFLKDVNSHCLHSLKSGGASNEDYKQTDPELKDRHAGWKNPTTKGQRYMKRSSHELLEVTQNMGIKDIHSLVQ